MAYRTTPSLGPDITQNAAQNYWDDIPNMAGKPSYPLGTRITGNDGHDYVYVKAGAAFAANDDLAVNETTWVATDGGGTGKLTAPVAVADGDFFHARVTALA